MALIDEVLEKDCKDLFDHAKEIAESVKIELDSIMSDMSYFEKMRFKKCLKKYIKHTRCRTGHRG